MENLSKEVLVSDFLNNSNLFEIVWDLRSIVDYYNKKKNIEWMNFFEGAIKLIIEETFYDNIEWNDLQEIILNIEDYDPSEYIDWEISIHTYDFIDSMNYFDTDIEIIDTDKTITDVLIRSQYQWYEELFENIREAFLQYLKWLDK